MHADTQSHPGEVLVQVTAHADDHGAAGAVNLFAHVSGGRRIPRLAMLVDSVYMDLNAGERRDIAFHVPCDRLRDVGDGQVQVTCTLDGDSTHTVTATLPGEY